ncbi:MAG: zinc ABC transporter substrate-binding protein [Desulfobacterales bacterium]|nr:zinc ABC transporter substrate-binding protein [Desulfobacterales bacterium]
MIACRWFSRSVSRHLAADVKAFVSIAPQQYFVQKIGGDLVDVSVLVPPGADPHTYEPKPRQMAELAEDRRLLRGRDRLRKGLDEEDCRRQPRHADRSNRRGHREDGPRRAPRTSMAERHPRKRAPTAHDKTHHHHGRRAGPPCLAVAAVGEDAGRGISGDALVAVDSGQPDAL